MPDNDDGTVKSPRPSQPTGDETVAVRLTPPVGDKTVVATRLPEYEPPPQFEPIPPPAPPPKKGMSRMITFGCGGCLLVVLLAGGIGAFLAMRGKGRGALPFFGTANSTIRGTIYDPSHKPLHMGQIQVVAHSKSGGKTSDVSATPGADGRYTLTVPKGPCTVESSLKLVPQGSNSITIPLVATAGATATSDCTSDSVRDFQWQLTGAVPGTDASKETNHFGAMISFAIDPSHFAGPAHLTIRFTPTGPLVDGSTASPVTVEKMTDDPAATQSESELPLGQWTIEASSTGGAQPEPLLVNGQPALALDLLQPGPGSLTQLQIEPVQPQQPATATVAAIDTARPPPPPPVHHATPPRKQTQTPAKKPAVTSKPVDTSDQTEVITTASTATTQDQKPAEQKSGFKKTLSSLRDKFRRHPKTDTDNTSTQSPPR